ncbi:MAG: exonuclease domain-containing protein [Salibacteraceae bacterium]
MKFAIVDIETTGGVAKKHAITEVAIIHHDGDRITDRFETLINPNVLIPGKITELTGISNEMVQEAPLFHEVAKEIWERTHDRIFVAHNVNFDYSFIRHQFALLGSQWRPKRLCTVRLSRKLFPQFYSYSLGKIAEQMGERIDGRHRAMGDCEFTSRLFLRLLQRDKEGHIQYALNARSRESTLPPNLDRKKFDKLPSTLGVYIFMEAKGRVIYVGKANDLKKRVSEHFRGNTHTGFKSRFAEKIEDIDWIESPNELHALLTEATLIKKHWPSYNRLMKRVSLNWGVFSYQDQNSFNRFNLGKVGKWDKPVISFRNRHEAHATLERLCRDFELCARFCGLQERSGNCFDEYHGACRKACIGEETPEEYNIRFNEALRELTQSGKTLLIKGKGFSENDQSIILIEKGRYKGHGVIPAGITLKNIDEVKAHLESGYDDQDIQSLILSTISGAQSEHELVVLS